LRASLAKQADKHEVVRLVSSGDPDRDLDLLELAASLGRRTEVGRRDKPLWMDLNGALSREDATDFVRRVASAARRGQLPTRVIIEQPVPVKYGDHLVTLQQQADEITTGTEGTTLDVRIMG